MSTPPPLMPSLEPILSDPNVLEILIDGFTNIYVERHGKLEDAPSPYTNHEQLVEELKALIAYAGFSPDESVLDIRLSDGSRVHIVMPPVAVGGPAVNIRKFPNKSFMQFDELIQIGALNEDLVTFLKACVKARLNMVIAGGTGSGKTTVMNVIAGQIPYEERIIAVGAEAELKLKQPRKVILEARTANAQHGREITVRDLLRSAVKMRPDRILVTDVLGGEMLEVLNAINMGHDGTIFSIHAAGAQDALSRMEIMATMGNPTLPVLTIREQIATALDIITYQERLPSGNRRIMKIAAVQGMRGDAVWVEDLFEYRVAETGEGSSRGVYVATGRLPRCLNRLREANPDLSLDIFRAR